MSSAVVESIALCTAIIIGAVFPICLMTACFNGRPTKEKNAPRFDRGGIVE